VRIDIALIGGTGIGERLAVLKGTPLHVPTPDGLIRGRLVEHRGISILALSRHSSGHKVPPHRVPYVAMASACKQLGAKACLATAAVGSLRAEWGPGTLVAAKDFFDLTYRNITFHERTVTHTDFSEPFPARTALLQEGVVDGGVYMGLNGPRYETPIEIKTFGQLGADLVGMTATTEAIVFREAGVPYGLLSIVTNLAAGLSEIPLNHEEVVVEMKRSGERAVEILLEAAVRLAQ
jgi:5'-methylthioadenosine phosphorylase